MSKPLQNMAKALIKNGPVDASTSDPALDRQPLIHQEDNPLNPYTPREVIAQDPRGSFS